MDEQRTFVGRKAELDRFREVLEDPRGQAIVVVGQAGMGKTWLIDRMTYLAEKHPGLNCAAVRYEVTPTDSVDATMELMMDHAFEAAKTHEGPFDMTDRRRTQWAALFTTFIPKGGDILELYAALRRDPQKHTREQFLDRLRLISKRMPENGRALFVIDPEKKMCSGCADAWRLVTRELPEKVKFLFAQRPEDELINSNGFMALDNVVRLPGERLGVLAPEEVEDLVRLRADEIGQSGGTLLDALAKYQRHPYAIQAAMEVVKKTRSLEDLPQDPTNERIAATQWQQVCRTGEDAIRLFEAYAILEVAVPRKVVEAVSDLDAVAMKRLLSDAYLRGLLREEGQGSRIYHAILGDHIRAQIEQDRQQTFHERASVVYRTSLKEAKEQHKAPDPVAAVRLPEHVLAAEGLAAFVSAFVNESTEPLLTLGLLDAAMGFSQRCREFVEKNTNEQAVIIGNQALILQARGDLDAAMTLLKEQERLCRQLGNVHGLQVSLGNQALILKARGDLDGAMTLHKEEERLCRQLGNVDGLQRSLGNQALILKARGDLDGAMALHKEKERLCRQLGKVEGLAISMVNQAEVLCEMGHASEALTLAEEAYQLATDHGYAALAKQIEPILKTTRQAAEGASGEAP